MAKPKEELMDSPEVEIDVESMISTAASGKLPR